MDQEQNNKYSEVTVTFDNDNYFRTSIDEAKKITDPSLDKKFVWIETLNGRSLVNIDHVAMIETDHMWEGEQ